MQDAKQKYKLENELIRQVKNGEDEALKKLFLLYKPLICNVKRKFRVRYYDSQDWDQDALIVCHASAMNFDQSKGKFGSYYKTRLTNHAKSLIRYDSAYRRQALTKSISLELATENGLRPFSQTYSHTPEVPLSETFVQLIKNLSNLEIMALLVALGVYQRKEAANLLKISQISLTRARSRLFRKMRQTLLN